MDAGSLSKRSGLYPETYLKYFIESEIVDIISTFFPHAHKTGKILHIVPFCLDLGDQVLLLGFHSFSIGLHHIVSRSLRLCWRVIGTRES